MAAEEQVPSARAEHIHVRAAGALRGLHHVHRLPAAMLQGDASSSNTAPETSVRSGRCLTVALSVRPVVLLHRSFDTNDGILEVLKLNVCVLFF